MEFKSNYAFLSYFLVNSSREQLEVVCNFVSGNWHKIWFGKHIFNKNNFGDFEEDIEKVGNCQKALTCLKTH